MVDFVGGFKGLRMTDETILREALARISRPASHYWAFWNPDGLDLDRDYEVEIRLNVPEGEEATAAAPEGWAVVRRKPGMLFLRRVQRIDKTGILRLFADTLGIAVSNGWRFHSWRHAPELRAPGSGKPSQSD